MASSGPRLDRHRTRRELCSRRYPRSDDETSCYHRGAGNSLASAPAPAHKSARGRSIYQLMIPFRRRLRSVCSASITGCSLMNAVRSFFCLMAARLFSMPANTTRGFRPLLTAAVYPSFSPAEIRGSGRNDRLTPLGFVKASKRESVTCWRNRRVKLCTSNYMTCECQSDSYYRCLHEDDMKQQAGEAATAVEKRIEGKQNPHILSRAKAYAARNAPTRPITRSPPP